MKRTPVVAPGGRERIGQHRCGSTTVNMPGTPLRPRTCANASTAASRLPKGWSCKDRVHAVLAKSGDPGHPVRYLGPGVGI